MIPSGRTEAEPAVGGDHARHGLRTGPFQGGTDPDLLWRGRAHQQILDRLRCGVLDHAGVLLLTGDVGTGKTILAKALLDRLRADTLIARVMYARHDPLDFSKEIGEAWGVGGPAATREAFYSRLPAFLDDAAARGKRVLLFVDEAQTLSQDLFTEIGHLAVVAGGSPHGQARLSILLVGQDELEAVLARPENAALAKRISVRCVTAPLTDAEVREYVAHQLKVTGAELAFTEDGLREIATASQGIPRLINTIADLAVLSSAQRGEPTIGAEVVRRSARMLGHSLGRVNRPESRRAKAPVRTPPAPQGPGRRAALYVPILAILLASGGYLYLSDAARDRDARRAPETSALPAAPPSPDRPAGGSVTEMIQPARATDAVPSALPTREPRASAGPVPPTLERPPARQAVSPPEPLPAPSVRRPAPSAVSVTEERREVRAPGEPSAPRNQDSPTAPPASSTRRPREVRTSEDSDAVDPAGIIDWLLSEYPARRQ